MPNYQVLITDYAWPDLDIEREILSSKIGAEVILPPDTSAATLARVAAPVDAIMTNWAKVPADGHRGSDELQDRRAARHRARQHRRRGLHRAGFR